MSFQNFYKIFLFFKLFLIFKNFHKKKDNYFLVLMWHSYMACIHMPMKA